MRIKMLVTHSYIPPAERRMSTKYLKDQEYTVKREWGEDMVNNLKVAREMAAPRRKADDGDAA